MNQASTYPAIIVPLFFAAPSRACAGDPPSQAPVAPRDATHKLGPGLLSLRGAGAVAQMGIMAAEHRPGEPEGAGSSPAGSGPAREASC